MGYNLLAFQFSNAKLQTTPVSSTSTTFAYPGVTPSISANATNNAIVWATENTNPAVLHAYDASDLSKELYNSNQAGARDQFGAGNKFITPTIANGKVYVGTANGVGAFGLLSGSGDFSIAVSLGGSTSATVSPGQTAQYSLSMTALGGFNQSVSFTCTGAPAEASCSVSPSSATAGTSATALMVSVSTTAPAQARNMRWLGPEEPLANHSRAGTAPAHSRASGNPMQRWMWLAAALLLAMCGVVARTSGFGLRGLFMGRGKSRQTQNRRAALIVLVASVLAVALWAGCGGGAGSAPMTNPGTPAGTYTLTVTGSSTSSSATLTHSIALQLVVN